MEARRTPVWDDLGIVNPDICAGGWTRQPLRSLYNAAILNNINPKSIIIVKHWNIPIEIFAQYSRNTCFNPNHKQVRLRGKKIHYHSESGEPLVAEC